MSNRVYSGSKFGISMPRFNAGRQRKLFIGVILLLALLAFEIFNFDTTQFALQSLLGDVTFLGILWATILAVAFCSIDFAGLIRLFSPERTSGGSKEVWYLMGAWLLGATMNAVMTWWAVSLTLLGNNYGNEVLSREQLLRYVPIFVAVLVWLTRILFIGAFSIAGDQLFESGSGGRTSSGRSAVPAGSPSSVNRSSAPARLKPKPSNPPGRSTQPAPVPPTASPLPDLQPTGLPPEPADRVTRVRQRPPVPNSGLRRPGSIQARSRNS